MKTLVSLLAICCLTSGCAVFEPPRYDAGGPTVPTGTYDSESEKWTDEALAAKRKAAKEQTEADLQKLDRN